MTKEANPTVMKAVQQDKPSSNLFVRAVPVPRPKSGQVLIRMAAAPINPSDLGTLLGNSYRGERSYPFTPGIEGSGTVVSAGKGLIPRLLKGRRVACSSLQPGNGTWAEYMVTNANLCAPLRQNVSLDQGATLLVNPLTALAIVEMVRKGKHRAIVNTAAASALGGMLVRLGQRHGIPMIHTVRKPEQIELVRSRGAEYVLNSEEPDFLEQLERVAKQLNATLLLDAIGGSMTQQLASAAPYGSTILLYSRLSLKDSVINAQTALLKNLHFDGWFLSNWLRTKNILQLSLLLRKAESLISSDLKSPIRKRLPLLAAQDGLEMYISDMSAGKILLVMEGKRRRSSE